MIPDTYQQWRHRITVACGIPLTADYIDQRLYALRNRRNGATIRFRELYGQRQLGLTIRWFEKAQTEAKLA